MKCPFCSKSVNVFSSEWKNQPQQNGIRKCPHCGKNVKNIFSGPISLAVLILTFGLAILGNSYIPAIPMATYGIMGGVGLIVFGLRLAKVSLS